MSKNAPVLADTKKGVFQLFLDEYQNGLKHNELMILQ